MLLKGVLTESFLKHRPVLAILLQKGCLQGALLKGNDPELSFSSKKNTAHFTQSNIKDRNSFKPDKHSPKFLILNPLC